jgi:dephospho-CoA kinase
MKPTVAVAGRIGSGKTTLASVLADRMECPRASFGDYVRFVAAERGLDCSDRTVLQDLGEELIGKGWNSFCRSVLDHARYEAGPVVIDGVRHISAIATIRELVAPTPCRLVAVRVPEKIRAARLHVRGVSYEVARASDGHPGESEVRRVIESADFIVEGEEPDRAADAVLSWLQRNGGSA